MANNFNYYAPTKVIFGKETEKEVGKQAKAFGAHKVLVHYGSSRVEKSGLLDCVVSALEAEGIQTCCLGGVVPNPRLSLVLEGIELCKKEGVDFILAIGGGSVIDSSKAIAYGCANEGNVWDFYEKKRQPQACLPVGVILTIAAAGSEMSNSSVITNEETGQKLGLGSDLCRVKFAIMNPELTTTLPEYPTQAGCVDIMMHTLERYFTSKGNMEITDAIAEGLVKTVMKNAKVLLDDPTNYDARAEVMWASSLSHNDLTGCGNGGNDFASHTLEHELSAKYDVSHGAGLAVIWPSWARYVYKDCLGRFVKFAKNVMGVPDNFGSDEEIALEGISRFEAFFQSIHMPTSLKEIGIDASDEDLVEMAKKAAVNCGGSRGSAKVLHEEDFLEIYRNANH